MKQSLNTLVLALVLAPLISKIRSRKASWSFGQVAALIIILVGAAIFIVLVLVLKTNLGDALQNVFFGR